MLYRQKIGISLERQDGTRQLGWHYQVMSKDNPQARRGMTAFVVTIFVIAVILAAIYIIGFTPGEP
ncbi:hypothetical protein YH62_16185 [Rhizobium sp. LC145]|nr:hypothetical protein YH62_16185 [Rhizobium sp. LC145]